MKRVSRFLSAFLIVILLLGSLPPQVATGATGATVDPESISLSLKRGNSADQTVSIRTAPTPIPKVDILFVFDVTGSMNAVLEQAKASGVEIMNGLRAKVSDSAFGVASFSDYPGSFSSDGYSDTYGAAGDYPWSLDQEITGEIDSTQAQINRLSLHDGKDAPEDYSRVLYESVLVGWRPGAKHIIVFFSDAIPHDADFLPYSTGVDPGLDGVAGTEDDLDFEAVVDQVKTRGIEIIPIDSSDGEIPEIAQTFQYMAEQTGGQVYPLREAGQLPDIVASSLSQATSVIGNLALVPDRKYADWVAIEPPSFTEVGGDQDRTFHVTLTVPTEAEPGTHSFGLTFAGDSATLGVVTVTLQIDAINLDAAEILAKKEAAIGELSTPTFVTKFIKGTRSWNPADHYAEEEKKVQAWLEDYKGKELTPAELEALYRLCLQEMSAATLFQSQIKVGNIGNTQVAHAFGLVLSFCSLFKFLDSIEGKSVVGLLVTKLKNVAYGKMAHALTTFLQYAVSLLPENTTTNDLKSGFKWTGDAFESAFSNALKSKTGKTEFTKDMLLKLLEDCLVIPLDATINRFYVQRTKGSISQGLEKAKVQAQGDISMTEAEAQAIAITEQVSASLGTVISQEQTLVKQAEVVEIAQDVLSVVADAVAAASNLAAATGVGIAYAQMGHYFAIACKVVDALLTVILAAKSYQAWYAAGDAANEIYSEAWASKKGESDLATALSPDGRPIWSTCAPQLAAKGILGASSSARFASLAGGLSEAAFPAVDQASYLAALDRLAEAIQGNDAKAIEAAALDFLQIDETIQPALLSMKQPIFAGASSAMDAGSEAFEPVYADFLQADLDFNGQTAVWAFDLLALLNEPANSQFRQTMLDQIQTLKGLLERLLNASSNALSMVPDALSRPCAVVVKYSTSEIVTSRSADLIIEVLNPSSSTAEGVLAILDPGSSAKLNSKGEMLIGSLTPGEKKTIQFQFIPNTELGFLGHSLEVSNGSGSYSLIPYNALPGVGGMASTGITLFFFLLLVAILATILFVVLRRTAGSMPSNACLVPLHGPQAGRSYPLSKPSITLGRSSSNHLQINDQTVSSQHAVIWYEKNAFHIKDQHSTNGTFVNERKVATSDLKDGDKIRLGRTLLRFQQKKKG